MLIQTMSCLITLLLPDYELLHCNIRPETIETSARECRQNISPFIVVIKWFWTLYTTYAIKSMLVN